MQRVYEFLKSTVVGGVFVLVPLVVLGVIAAKAVEVVQSLLQPLLGLLPLQTFWGLSLAVAATGLVLVLLCFLAGLAAELALTKQLVEGIESLVLARIPGYTLMKAMGESFVGVEGKEPRKTVLVQFDDSRQLGFLMEELPDGLLVVYVPDVPHTLSGTLHLLPRGQVVEIAVPVHSALESLARLGVGLRQKWPAVTPDRPQA